jgi:hypothetical protein
MFRASLAHPREAPVLKKTRKHPTSITARCAPRTVFVKYLLRMGKWCPEHVEASSLNKVNVKFIKLVRVIKLYRDVR